MTSFSELYSLSRSCAGAGINHENQKFEGTINFSPITGGKGTHLHFKAVGEDGTVFHEESSLGTGFDGKPCLFVLGNNHPGVTPHILKKSESTLENQVFVFGFGDISDEKSFREEIALTLWKDGFVEYKYFWRLPGGGLQSDPALKCGRSKNENQISKAFIKKGDKIGITAP